MLIMERDKILFQKLHKYAVMTTKQVGATVFPNVDVKTVLRRLGKLENENYIERIEGLSNYHRVWLLTPKGSLLVSDRPPRRRQSRFQLEHDVMLTALRLKLEEYEIAKVWHPEHEIRAKVAAQYGIEAMKRKTIPDGIMGLEASGFKESVAIELELHSKNAKRYRRTFYDYGSKSELYAVWYLTPTKELAKHIEKLWLRENGKIARPKFLWSLANDVLLNGANATIHSQNTSKPISEVWSGKIPNLPADTPADRVSTLNEKTTCDQIEITTENTSETLTPHH